MATRLRCAGEGEAVQQDHEEDQDIDNDRHACNGDVAYSCSMDPYISTVQYSICSHFSFHFISFLQTRHMVLGGDSVSLCCLVVFTHTHTTAKCFFSTRCAIISNFTYTSVHTHSTRHTVITMSLLLHAVSVLDLLHFFSQQNAH